MKRAIPFLFLASACWAQQPVVRSFAFTTLFSGVSATATQTSSAQRLGNFGAYGTLAITGASITGSPAGCQVALDLQTSVGAPASSAVATQAFTPNNTYQSFTITPSAGFNAGGTMIGVYTCSTYPTGGTITVEYYTIDVAAMVYPLPAGANVIGAITQSGTWTVQPGNTANTTPWLATLNQGGNSATVTASNALKVDGSAVTQPVSGTVSVNALPGGSNTIGKVDVLGNAGAVMDAAGQNVAQPANWLSIGCEFVTTPTTITSGNGSPCQLDNAGNLLAKINVALPAGGNTIGAVNQGTNPWTVAGALSNNGAAAGANRVGTLPGVAQNNYNNGTASTQGRDVALNVGTDGLLQTAQLPAMRPASYTAASKFAASSTTDNSCMPGNATNTVLVTELRVTGVQTTAGILNAEIIKRSAADTGGTSANITAVPDDSNYAAASSQPVSYTSTGPTVGTAVGDIDDAEIGFMAAATAAPNDIYLANWRQKPIVLRGTAQEICVNLGGAVTGGTMTVTWKWIETTTITP